MALAGNPKTDEGADDSKAFVEVHVPDVAGAEKALVAVEAQVADESGDPQDSQAFVVWWLEAQPPGSTKGLVEMDN